MVDEVAVIPPRDYQVSSTATLPQAGQVFTVSSTNTFDGQKRLVSRAATSPVGTITTTFSGWDASGRPTVATTSVLGVSSTESYAYDNAARTKTITAAGRAACTETYDASGVVVASSCEGSTTTITILATQQVCK